MLKTTILPGLIVDRYGDWLVLQALTLHIDQQKADDRALLTDIYAELQIAVKGIYERSDVDVRRKEGLSSRAQGLLLGRRTARQIDIRWT